MARFLLQENNDFLLQENGDKVILDYPISDIGFEITGINPGSSREFETTGKDNAQDENAFQVKGTLNIPISRTYRILVKDENDNVIGEFDKFRKLEFGKRLNNYGTASFEIPLDDPKTESLVSLRKYSVWIYYQKDATSTLVWSGEQALRSADLKNDGNNWATIHCYDWLELLNSRYTDSEKSYEQIDAGEIAWTLIDESQREAVDDSALFNPEDVTNDTQIGTLAWAWDDLVNGLASDDNPLSVDLGAGGITNYLAFQFFPDMTPLPTGAIITGIKVEIEIAQDTGVGGNAIDTSVVLLSGLDQSIISDDLARGEQVELDPDIYTSYGGQNNLWGAELDVADINTNGIFAAFSYTGEISILNVDHARMTIYYYTLEVSENFDFGITKGTIEATVDRDRTYYNDNIMEKIIQLSNVLSGFDFEIDNNKVFNVYSVKGVDKTNDVILEYGVNIATVKLVEDFVRPINKAIVLGQSTEDLENLVRIERNDTGLQAEYKVREGLLSEMDVSETDTMNDKGDAMIRKFGTPLIKVDIDMASVQTPNITQFSLGDAIRLIIKSGVYNIDEDYRVFEWNVTFDSNNVETLSLTLGNFTYE